VRTLLVKLEKIETTIQSFGVCVNSTLSLTSLSLLALTFLTMSSILRSFPSGRPTICVMPGDKAYATQQILHGYKVPDLSQRKGIWTHFPVTLTRLDSTDGTDRYAVRWHENNLRAWAAERSASWGEHYNYKEFCYTRLMYSLVSHAKVYRLERPAVANDVCVIAMVHK
jgi:hypothetical protein